MRRGKPLKRGKGLERRELKADVERVREFLKRGKALDRKPLRSKPKPRPAEGPLSPAEWAAQVFELSEGRCIITGARARDAFDRRFHAHHPLPKRELRARGLAARVWDPRNGVLLRRDVHVRHEDAFERVPHTALPLRVWEFCRELDELEGSQWATTLVLRAHPVRGARGHSQHEEVRRAEGRERDRPEG